MNYGWVALRVATVLAAASSSTYASLEGIPANYTLRGNSRPCCGFAETPITFIKKSRFIDSEKLGHHDFGQLIRKEKVPAPAHHEQEVFGQLFTCKAGFVDIAHLRDNADWAATIYRELLTKLGTGATIEIRKENNLEKTELLLPVMSKEVREKITPEMIGQMAIALTFDLAVFHEIGTAFAIAVSGPRVPLLDKLITERSSAFSVEDNYSNLLGAHLGIRAVNLNAPYNEAMTQVLQDEISSLKAPQKSISRAVHRSLRGTWWAGGPIPTYRKVRVRLFGHKEKLTPQIPRTDEAIRVCGEVEPKQVDLPSIQSTTGMAGTSVAFIRQFPNRPYAKRLKKLGVRLNADGSFTRDQFDVAIDGLTRKMYRQIPHLNEFR